MAGIYVHVPFCRKACHYCNFHFSTSIKYLNDFVAGLIKEIDLQKHYLNQPVTTLYFGGGTPSLLPSESLEAILNAIYVNFDTSSLQEVTLEANPDDITPEKLLSWKQLGINRLSIGVQSFFNEDLLWMNRAHNVDQAIDSIHLAKQHGFDNLTIDLIYGTPTLSDEAWQKNLQTAMDLRINHLSCYALTVEPKTALDTMINQRKIEGVDPEKQARHFDMLQQFASSAGYEQYEISNFAKHGFRSRHNSSYWLGVPYLGLGPSAHSFNGISRQWNVANNALYIQNINNQVLPFEIEILTPEQRLNEYIMTSLRTSEGVNLFSISEHFGIVHMQAVMKAATPHLTNETVQLNGNFLQLTARGKFLADGIASDLFQL
ncbi:MAG: radical SAM family heme chaperone HemW [Chitinophagaceae bacterium]|nr:radical SAM family heme chaperone HemW [Chitinophagaceae bacterium]